MKRIALALALVLALAAPGAARAGSLPSFDARDCTNRASHIVVVNDKGAVLESWRGDLAPGDRVPLDAFDVALEHEIKPPFGEKLKDKPKKVTGKRLVVFLKRGGSRFGNGQEIGSWGAANGFGWFNASMAWIEDGQAFGLVQWINPGPQVMSHVGTEDDLKKHVAKVNTTLANEFAKARAEKDTGKRAELLAAVVNDHPGFAAEALAGLEWGGEAALPALRKIVAREFAANSELLATYGIMSKIGAPARDDLMKVISWQLPAWKDQLARIEYNAEHKIGFEVDERYWHRLLLVVTANPDAFAGVTAEQQKLLRELRDLWAGHAVLSKVGEKGDRVADRLDRILAKLPR